MHLQFARGWLELGDVQEAETELRQIRSEFLDGPEVLEVRFQVLARRQRYAEGLELALRQIAFFPNDFRGYMNRGNALFWLDRSVEAIDSVMQVLADHPRVAALPYNLACYWMKLGSSEEAIRWLDSAIQIGQRKGVLQHALSDPDLRPIWDYIRRLEADREES
jgi:predicted Zn-dependent protease